MKKVLALVLALLTIMTLCACGGSSDALKGTWKETNASEPSLTMTWTFDGKGKCTAKNDYTDTMNGIYSINGSVVTIKLDVWDGENKYDFTVSGDTLTMKGQGYAPSYTLIKSK